MAISSGSTSVFTSPHFTFNSLSSSQSVSASVKLRRSTITATSATAERTATATATATGTIRSFRNNARPSSLYDVLGVGVGADTREIKSAYRKLARVLHPDVGTRDSSADEFMKVQSAYSTLGDPEKRAVYDKGLLLQRPAVAGGGYRCRRWETDQCW